MMYAPVNRLGPTLELLQCAAVAFTGSISESSGDRLECEASTQWISFWNMNQYLDTMDSAVAALCCAHRGSQNFQRRCRPWICHRSSDQTVCFP